MSGHDVGADAATLPLGEIEIFDHTYIRRSRIARKLFQIKNKHSRSPDCVSLNASLFVGKALVYTPQHDLLSMNLRDAAELVRGFIKQCLRNKKGLWSIIKEIIIDVPCTNLHLGLEYVILPESINLSTSASKFFMANFLSGPTTVIYVCDERKMDGDSRRLLKSSLWLDGVIKRSKVRQIYLVVRMASDALQTEMYRHDKVYHRLLRTKMSELQSIVTSKLRRKHASMIDVFHDTFFRTCKVVGLDQQDQQVGIDELDEFLKEDMHVEYKVALNMCANLLRRIARLCSVLQNYIDDTSELSNALLNDFVFKQSLVTVSYVRKRIEASENTESSSSGKFTAVIEDWFKDWKFNLFRAVEPILTHWESVLNTDICYHKQYCASELRVENVSKKRKFESLVSREPEPSYTLISCLVHAMATQDICLHLLRRLRALNTDMLRQLRFKLIRLFSSFSSHPFTLVTLKRLIRLKVEECKQLCISLLSFEWIQEIFESYTIKMFQEELLCVGAGSTSTLTARIFSSVRNDIFECFKSRIRSLRLCCTLIVGEIFDIVSAQNYSREIRLANNLRRVLANLNSRGILCLKLRFQALEAQRKGLCTLDLWDNVGEKLAYRSIKSVIERISGASQDKILFEDLAYKQKSDNLFYSPRFDLRHVSICHLDRVIFEGLCFIEREGLKRSGFFGAWGSDLLATFLFFREISYGTIQHICDTMLQRFVKCWLTETSGLCKIETIEDFLFYNEGCYVLNELGIKHERIQQQIEENVSRWSWTEYLALDHEQMRKRRLRSKNHVHFDKLSTAMIWAFFLSGNKLSIPGTSAADIEILCELSGALDQQVST